MKLTPFFMFEGKAEEAMNFYLSLFKNSEVLNVVRYGKEGPGPEGSILHAMFSLNGHPFMCIDSWVKHEFTFTPAMSVYVDCDSEEELLTLSEQLSKGGSVLMPLDNYGFSQKYAWVNDQYGVSWQLNLP